MPALAATLLGACDAATDTEPGPPDANVVPQFNCGRGGYLTASLFGAVSADLNWQATAVSCEGMPRPDARGARLRFAGHAADIGQDLAIIIAMPDLQRGATGDEMRTNVTVILEGSGRFFNTATDDICWTDVLRQDLLSDERYAIGGKLYCIGPLVEVNGDASVSIRDLEFSGLLDWTAK